MAFKFRVKSLDEVEEKYRDLYRTDGDTGYVLDTEDDPAEGMRKARDHEKQRRQKAEDELRKAKEDKSTESDSEWKTKYDQLEQSSKETIARQKAAIDTMLVGNVANEVAAELFTVPSVMATHIKARLHTEEVDGKPVTKVLGADGKPSDMSIDDLKAEFKANKEYEPVLKKTSATGGTGIPKQRQNGGGNGDDKPTNLADLSTKDLVQHMKDKNQGGQ